MSDVWRHGARVFYTTEELIREGIVHKFYGELNLIPIKKWEKAPAIQWAKYQTARFDGLLYRPPDYGNIAVVTGWHVGEGYFVVVDLDKPELFEPFRDVIGKTFVVQTPRGGYHIYVLIKGKEPPATRRAAGVDIKGFGGYVLIPPSRTLQGEYKIISAVDHPRELLTFSSEREFYDWLAQRLGVDLEKLAAASEREGGEAKGEVAKTPPGRRKLTETEIVAIVQVLKKAYKPGYRDYIILYLTGWLRKADVAYESAHRIVVLLAEGDEEFKQRLYVLDRTYGLKGTPPDPEELKGKTGLQEVLEEALGSREEAITIIREIEEILGVPSPWRDVMFSTLDFERGIVVVNDRRNNVIVKAKLQNGKLNYGRIIAETAILGLTVYENPLNGEVRFDVKFTSVSGTQKSTGPVTVDVVVGVFKAQGVVKSKRDIEDALNAIITRMVSTNVAEVKREIESPGFYIINNELRNVRWEPPEYNTEALREALLLLKELREVWYSHLGERFTTIVKWGLMAPFNYAMKQLRGVGVHMPWLLLYGESMTGKSTLGYIIKSLWGLPPLAKAGSSIETTARLAMVLSESTFPTVVNEVTDILRREDNLEMLKNAVENTIARQRIEAGVYKSSPALSPLIMTCNYLPARAAEDPGVFRRLYVIRFTPRDKLTKDKVEKFDAELKPQLEKLKALGAYVFNLLRGNVELLKHPWQEVAQIVLEAAIKDAGLWGEGDWSWIGELAARETEEEYREETIETIRARIMADLNDRYARLVDKTHGYLTLGDRLDVLLKANLVPYILKKDSDAIIITAAIKRELELRLDLKTLAELLGWEYKPIKISGQVLRGAVVEKKKFMEFLEPKTEGG